MSAASLSGTQAASPAATPIKRKASSVLEGEDDDVCGLAKRIPKARKGPDEVENRRKDLIRRCLIKSVDFLCKHEAEYAQTVWNMLEANMVSTKPPAPLPTCSLTPQRALRKCRRCGKRSFWSISAKATSVWTR